MLTLAADDMQERVACGLVTGNVEGIARKKMRSVGVHATGALAPPAAEQRWAGEEDAAFLGGFGSGQWSAAQSRPSNNGDGEKCSHFAS